jgi:hypothetical protein
MQWKACVAEDTGFDSAVLDPQNGITSDSLYIKYGVRLLFAMYSKILLIHCLIIWKSW